MIGRARRLRSGTVAWVRLRRQRCSSCGQRMTAPACSLNRMTGWSGHTVAGNGGRPVVDR
jgi:hypothetical protein